jgi:hypothetical protein
MASTAGPRRVLPSSLDPRPSSFAPSSFAPVTHKAARCRFHDEAPFPSAAFGGVGRGQEAGGRRIFLRSFVLRSCYAQSGKMPLLRRGPAPFRRLRRRWQGAGGRGQAHFPSSFVLRSRYAQSGKMPLPRRGPAPFRRLRRSWQGAVGRGQLAGGSWQFAGGIFLRPSSFAPVTHKAARCRFYDEAPYPSAAFGGVGRGQLAGGIFLRPSLPLRTKRQDAASTTRPRSLPPPSAEMAGGSWQGAGAFSFVLRPSLPLRTKRQDAASTTRPRSVPPPSAELAGGSWQAHFPSSFVLRSCYAQSGKMPLPRRGPVPFRRLRRSWQGAGGTGERRDWKTGTFPPFQPCHPTSPLATSRLPDFRRRRPPRPSRGQRKNPRCLSLMGMPMRSITVIMSSQTMRLVLFELLRKR